MPVASAVLASAGTSSPALAALPAAQERCKVGVQERIYGDHWIQPADRSRRTAMLTRTRTVRATIAAGALTAVGILVLEGGALAQNISGPVRVAIFGPMTGPYAATGKQIWTGAKQCSDEINAAGGVAGAQLELVQTDDEGDPGKGTLAAQKIADDASVVATLGWLNSSVAIPTSDIFAPINLAMISVGATNPVLTARGHPNVFRVVADDDYQAPAQYLYLKKTFSPTKIALVDESTES